MDHLLYARLWTQCFLCIISFNPCNNFIYCSRFLDNPYFRHEETETQRGQAIWPRSYTSSVEHPGPGLRSDHRTPELVLWKLWMCVCCGVVFRWVHRGRDWVPGSEGSPRGEGRCLILGPWQPENQQLHHRCEGPPESRCSWSHHPVEQQGGVGVSAPPAFACS